MVVSIIALLVAILLPSLHEAREQARRAVCASNLHQLGLVFHLYAEDNEGWLPHTSRQQHGQPFVGEWFMFYSPYLSEKLLSPDSPLANGPRDLYAIGKAMPVFDCPSTASPPGFEGYHGPDGRGYSEFHKTFDYIIGYAYRGAYGLDGKKLHELLPRRLLLIDYLGGSTWLSQWGFYEDEYSPRPGDTFVWNGYYGGYGPYLPGFHHNNGANILFPDAHAEWHVRDDYQPFWEGGVYWMVEYVN